MIDLHTHTTASDGRCSPVELVARAAAAGVSVLSVTDHDTVDACEAAGQACVAARITFVPGIEITAVRDEADVHVLGYFLDPADAALEDRLRWLRVNRGRRIELMVENLNTQGYPVALSRVMEIAQGGSLGRPHLAQALHEAGHVPTYDSAFDTLIAKDAPAYVARVGLSPLEAVQLVVAHGGVPSLAHPFTVVGLEELMPLIVAAGLAGIEAYYGSHPPEMTASCLALARRYDLVPTGGSDFHGRGDHGALLGGVFVPPESIAALEARRGPNSAITMTSAVGGDR